MAADRHAGVAGKECRTDPGNGHAGRGRPSHLRGGEL
jgi:hypothetical protein